MYVLAFPVLINFMYSHTYAWFDLKVIFSHFLDIIFCPSRGTTPALNLPTADSSSHDEVYQNSEVSAHIGV